MKKAEIARRMARQTRVSRAEAADRLDRIVHQIVSSLRSGKSAKLPGLGKFIPAANGLVRFERERGARR